MLSFNAHTDLLSFLNTEIDARYLRPAGALFTVALVPIAGAGAMFATGKVTFLDEPTLGRGAFVYPAMTLAEEWVEGVAGALDRLRLLLVGEALVAGQAVLGRFGSTYSERNVHSLSRFTSWAEWDFNTAWHQEGPRPSLYNEPLLAFGLPPYSSTGAAVSEWVYGRPPKTGSDAPHMNQLHTILPDTRATISDAKWEHDEVVVSVAANCPREELELHAVFLDSKKDRCGVQRAPDAEVRLPVPADASAVWLALIHSSGARLGETHLNQSYRSMMEEQDRTPLDESVRHDISACENERVEFKPFIKPGDSKEREVVKTVVAFANTQGGRVLLGVDDERQLLGHANLASALPPGDGRDAETRLRAWASKLIGDHCKPVPRFTVNLLQVDGEPVGVIEVKRGETHERPFQTRENVTYVRKGSNNVKPDLKTEWASYFVGAPALGILFGNNNY